MNELIFKLFYQKAFFGVFFIFLAVFLGGCSQITGSAAREIPKETAREPQVYFCPRDDCSKVYEDHISSANLTVHCAFYDLNSKGIISALSKKSKTADVKLVMDGSNYREQVKGDGVKLDDDGQLMHNKFCVIDSGIVITGSFNPTFNDNYRNNNNVVVFYSNALAKNYQDEFDEVWDGRFGKGTGVKYPRLYINGIKIENYFCPEDKCEYRIVDLVEDAKSSVYFMSFSFTSGEIANALIKKEKLDIKGIFDSEQSSSKFSQLKRLQDSGVNARKDRNKYKMHHKVFIIDNETVATGSFNPTLSADTKNDENLLIIHDKKIANIFLKEFDDLWGQ